MDKKENSSHGEKGLPVSRVARQQFEVRLALVQVSGSNLLNHEMQ